MISRLRRGDDGGQSCVLGATSGRSIRTRHLSLSAPRYRQTHRDRSCNGVDARSRETVTPRIPSEQHAEEEEQERRRVVE